MSKPSLLNDVFSFLGLTQPQQIEQKQKVNQSNEIVNVNEQFKKQMESTTTYDNTRDTEYLRSRTRSRSKQSDSERSKQSDSEQSDSERSDRRSRGERSDRRSLRITIDNDHSTKNESEQSRSSKETVESLIGS